MSQPIRQDIDVFRKDPLQIVIIIFGVDLTGNTSLLFAAKLWPDIGGAPLLSIASGAGPPGIAVVDVGTDTDGTPYSTIVISDTKAHMAALPPPPEPGAAVKLSYDIQWTPPTSITAPVPSVETTLAYGKLNILGSVND